MTELQLLQQCFPIEVASKIMRFHSHPTADIIKDLIKEFKEQEAGWIDYHEVHLKYINRTENYYFLQWWYQSMEIKEIEHYI